MHAPDLMPILSAGAHSSPAEGACVMEMASYLAGEEWSDSPACTHPVLARMAQVVNDWLPDDERGVLLDLLPRLMGTAPTGTHDERICLSVNLAVWAAEQVTHLTGEAEPQAREAIRATRAWLEGEATQHDCIAAAVAAERATAPNRAVFTAAHAARAANAAPSLAYVEADAENAVYYAAAAVVGGDRIALLTGLLDEHDRLTGRTTPAPLATDDVQRLAELTNH